MDSSALKMGALALALLGLMGLGGCASNCAPAAFYRSQSLPPLKTPPGETVVKHDKAFDIPGGPPKAVPPMPKDCQLAPPNMLQESPAPAETATGAAASGATRQNKAKGGAGGP